MKEESRILKRRIPIMDTVYKDSLYHIVNKELDNKNYKMTLNQDYEISSALDMLEIKDPIKLANLRSSFITADIYKESNDYLDIIKLGYYLIDVEYIEEKNKKYAQLLFIDLANFILPTLEGIEVNMPDIDINTEFINLAFKDMLFNNSIPIYKESNEVENGDVITIDIDYLTKNGDRVVKKDLVVEIGSDYFMPRVYDKLINKKLFDTVIVFEDDERLKDFLDSKITIKEIFATKFNHVNLLDYSKFDDIRLKECENEFDLRENILRLIEEEVSDEMVFSLGEEIVIEILKKINLETLPTYFKYKYFMLSDIELLDKAKLRDEIEKERYNDLYKIVIFKLMLDLDLVPSISKKQESIDLNRFKFLTKSHLVNDFDMNTLKKVYKHLIKNSTIK